LSKPALKTISDLRRQFTEQLSEIGFLPSGISMRDLQKIKHSDGVLQLSGEYYNINNKNYKIIKAILCAGLYPNIVKIKIPETRYHQTASGSVASLNEVRELKFVLKSKEQVYIHPKSVNFSQSEYESPFLAFFEKIETSKLFVTDTTMIPPWGLLFFGGEVSVLHEQQVVKVNDWIKFSTPGRIGVLIKQIRVELDKLLEAKIDDPLLDIASSSVIDAISLLITKDGVL